MIDTVSRREALNGDQPPSLIATLRCIRPGRVSFGVRPQAQDGTQDGLGSFVYNSRKKGEEIGKPDSVPFPNKER